MRKETDDLREARIPEEFRASYERYLASLRKDPGGFQIFREPVFENGAHPENFVDYECAFAARHISLLKPREILDIGSYRRFILGLLAHYPVTTLDVRDRRPHWYRETVLTGDAKKLNLPGESFDFVLSLCAIEHFGLGRYGDEFDPQADRKAFEEMIRVLRPEGHLLFSTTITGGEPAIGFNAHRIYTRALLHDFCAGLKLCEENFYSHRQKGLCSPGEITVDPRGWDIYLGCWQKLY